MRDHLRLVIAAAIATTALTATAAAVPAQAAGPLVLGQNQSLGGLNWTFTSNNTDIASTGGDRASSIRNDDVVAWVVYQHDTYRGRAYCILPGQEIWDLHEQQWQFGDMISSVRRRPDATCHDNPMFQSP
jgi:hypothetical protein